MVRLRRHERSVGMTGQGGDVYGPGLDETLEALRADLANARAKAAASDVQFPIESLTIELKVGVTRNKAGKVGFRVPVIDAELGGSVGVDRETLQTVTVTLGPPIDRDGRPIKVGSSTDEVKG
jgi:Trypsin-co-occurring domain 2